MGGCFSYCEVLVSLLFYFRVTQGWRGKHSGPFVGAHDEYQSSWKSRGPCPLTLVSFAVGGVHACGYVAHSGWLDAWASGDEAQFQVLCCVVLFIYRHSMAMDKWTEHGREARGGGGGVLVFFYCL